MMCRHMSRVPFAVMVVVGILLGRSASCPSTCSCPTANTAECYGAPEAGRLPPGLPPGLTSLVLNHHNLSRIATDTLAGLPALQHLQLQNDRIRWLQPTAFHALPLLETVGLQDNFLEYLEPNTFLNNPRLWFLDLSGNDLHAPDKMAFLSSRSLRELNASRCRLDYLPDEAFQGLTELRVLHLEDNYLNFLRMRMLAPLRRLTHLYLQNNKIKSLRNMPASSPLSSVTYIDLSGNFLTTLDAGALQVAVALTHLFLLQNPLLCDCGLAPARAWLLSRGVQAPGHCAAPYQVLGADWQDVGTLSCVAVAPSSQPASSSDYAAHWSGQQHFTSSLLILPLSIVSFFI